MFGAYLGSPRIKLCPFCRWCWNALTTAMQDAQVMQTGLAVILMDAGENVDEDLIIVASLSSQLAT